MFKIRGIKALKNNTSLRNLARLFINEQGSCVTFDIIQLMDGFRKVQRPLKVAPIISRFSQA